MLKRMLTVSAVAAFAVAGLTACKKEESPADAAGAAKTDAAKTTDAAKAEATAKARAAGASKGAKLKALHGRRRRLDSQAALGQFVTDLVYDVVEGKQDPDVARCALYGASILRQLAEHGIERRLAEVERLLAMRRQA